VDRLILVRHAETTFNAQGLMNPDSRLEAPLSPAGERAARELAGALAAEAIELAVCSPRLRARRTAELALAGRGVRTVVDPDLAEIAVGAFEGQPVERFRHWLGSHPATAAPPGGESLVDAAGRYLLAFGRLRELSVGVVMVVLHNLPMRLVLNAGAGEDPLAGAAQRVPQATPVAFAAAELDDALPRLAAWRRAGLATAG
jgi:2,3-bisphosphoglycerate-dependent phosphoglycerate mutase